MKETCLKCGKVLPENHEMNVCDDCYKREIEKQ